MNATGSYRAARDQLLALRGDHARAVAEFRWPELGDRSNWAVDWFDAVARDAGRPALVVVEEDGSFTERSFAEMSRASDRLAAWLTGHGVGKGDTTSRPKLVEHTQVSYPVGHMSTMYWLGLRPGDVHLNISSPGWAKHAWSCFFAPWIAEATIFAYNYRRFDAAALLRQLRERKVSSFCAPPTVWRMLINADLGDRPAALRETVSAGEPLNPEVIEQVRRAWGLTIRDGFGQTETTAQAGNTPGSDVRPGSMGRAPPGVPVVLVDPVTNQALSGPGEGEICLDLRRHPVPLMTGYQGDPDRNAEVMAGGYYHTGDVATIDADGYITLRSSDRRRVQVE